MAHRGVLPYFQWNETRIGPTACERESVPGCVKLAHFCPATVAKAAAEATAVPKKGGIPRGLGLRSRQVPLPPLVI